ncbi:hypothetical protein [Falsibacillus pallidus]|uniref:hypothetical protein n=1 Tax=Falsibacillus pallidus TaxID=493781 RepID=UPI003D96E592
MKKILLLILTAVFMMSLFACSNQPSQMSNNDKDFVSSNEHNDKIAEKGDVREKVWGQLSSEQRERINGTWKDGEVSKVTLNNNMMSQVNDKSYEGKVVYLIDFPTKSSNSVPNNMIVYADVNTFDYIGNGLVD